ncbi:regulatory protein ToxS [Photobacterium sp. Hal280]|uniref:regulatory protein ToxS n=1 Tax=Photobacterium sp. Hal280 TaxID=3035163 RepID=UPI00301DF8F3
MFSTLTQPGRIHRYYLYLILSFASLVTLGSLYYFFSSDHKISRFLAAHHWQSYTVTDVASTEVPGLEILKKVVETSHIVYMPNQAYSRVTRVTLMNEDQGRLHLTITEYGRWEVSGGYLQVRPTHFNELKTGDESAFSDQQIAAINQYFQLNAEQSNRIDIMSEKAVLLTGLNTRSQVLNANL